MRDALALTQGARGSRTHWDLAGKFSETVLGDSGLSARHWLRAGSILISLAAITLLATAFGARFYPAALSSVLLTLVLIALCVAIALHVRFLRLARREQRETVNALDATEREYKTVYPIVTPATVKSSSH